MSQSELEDRLAFHIKATGLPKPEREFMFATGIGRKWRADFAFPDRKLLVEIEGGSWVNGAHSRGLHFQSDCDKYNHAVMLGWKVLRFTTDDVTHGRAIAMLERVFKG